MRSGVLRVKDLGFPWSTADPFLFCVYHRDSYPAGNGELGVDAKHLRHRNLGNDFTVRDGFRMYHGHPVPGFPRHPHRGFETITVVRRGLCDHSDTLGASARYGNGDCQWMTAGKGIQHAEMFPLVNEDGANELELFQIWINLPSKSKFVEPYFTMLWNPDVPVVQLIDADGRSTEITSYAWSVEGHEQKMPSPPPDSWASDQENEVAVWLITMEPNAEWSIQTTREDANRTLFCYAGDGVTINGTALRVEQGADLESTTAVVVKNGDVESRFLMLQGKRINEPVVQHGPFVMNTNTQIQEAIEDFRSTQFGRWPHENDAPTNGRKGRFATHADGTLERPSDGEQQE